MKIGIETEPDSVNPAARSVGNCEFRAALSAPVCRRAAGGKTSRVERSEKMPSNASKRRSHAHHCS